MKPALASFYLDDDENLWVHPWAASGQRLDVFDPHGRFLGAVRLPFVLSAYPEPIIRRGHIYGVVRDELDVPFVVAAHIEKR